MSFIGQSIRNRFPLWSTIRRDDSSVGGRVLDSIGESIELIRVSSLRMQDQLKTLEGKPIAEPGHLWNFNLSDSDEYVRHTQENKEYSSIAITGVIGENSVLLRESNSYEQLCLEYPTRTEIEIHDTRIDFKITSFNKEEKTKEESWNFNNKIYKVYFNIKNSDYYYDSRTKEKFDYNYFITIRGTNIADFPIEETIFIKDDGFYETKNYFKEIKALKREPKFNIKGGKSIEREGFDGEIEVYIKPYNIQAKEYTYSLFVEKSDRVNKNNSLIENKGFFELRKENEVTYLDYIYRYYDMGNKYRIADIESPEAFQDILFSQTLLGTSGENLDIVDYCFDTVRNKLTTIDSSGVIRFYKIGKTGFNQSILRRTKLIDFSLESIRQQVSLYETAKIYGYLERPKGPVANYIVLKEKNGVYSSLQEDNSWGNSIHLFQGRDRADVFENADSFEFENYFDSIGQTNFHIISFTTETKDLLLLQIKNQSIFEIEDLVTKLNSYAANTEQYEVYINNYSMMCEYSLPEYSIETGFSGENFGIFYEGISNDLFVIKFEENNQSVYKIKEYKDYFLFDYESGEGVTLEKYDSIEVSIDNGVILEEVSYD